VIKNIIKSDLNHTYPASEFKHVVSFTIAQLKIYNFSKKAYVMEIISAKRIDTLSKKFVEDVVNH
jgi:hypothetical protein